jgi:ATP-binding cassette subfamily B multidrug efflux pump
VNQSMAYTPKASDKGTFSRLLAYLRPHTKALLLAFILLLVGTAADVIGPILIKTFIDKYLSPRFFPLQQMLILGGGYLLLQLSTAVFNYLQLVSFQKIALKVIQRLRVDVFHNVQRLGLSFFDRTPTGALVSRITNDTEAIKDLYVSVLSTFVQNTVLLTGIFISMFALNVHLALLCLVLIPIIITIMEVYRRFSSKVFHAARQRLSQLNAQLSESLQGMSLIQALRQERRIQKEFETVNHAYKSARIKNIQLNGLLLRPLVDVVYLLTLMLVLGFFGSQSLTQTIDIGALYAFINYLDRFFEPVNAMMMRLNLFQQAIVSADRVFALMDEDDLAPSKLGTEHPVIDQGLVSFEHVTFSYDGKSPVLKDITFTAYPGQTVALVGHTGSGKSSITNLLMRFYAIEQGTIRIDGRDIRNYDNNELRHQIGLVLQDPFLFVGDI